MLTLFCIALSFAFLTLWAVKPPRVRTYKRAGQIRSMLNPPNLPLGSLLLARSLPNQRLVDAFGLTNTFVSKDAKIHKTFTSKAKALISGAGDKDDRWRAVGLSAQMTVRQFLPDERVEFATFIQCVTLAVVLSTLFGTDLDAIRYGDLVYVTQVINQRWKDSKIKDAAAMRQDGSLERMLGHIDEWIVDRDQHPNPLNFILPAYETMWRVVAVIVAYVYRCRDNTLQGVALEFGRDPTEARFQAFGDQGLQPSMQAIVLEVLRLHPPTRHIARAPASSGSWWGSWFKPAIEVADIEAVHMSEAYGADWSVFEPMRFHPSRTPAELYAFGYGRLRCVAAGWAPMAAGVIAAKVVVEMEEGEGVVTVGDRIGGRSGWDGWTVGRKGAE